MLSHANAPWKRLTSPGNGFMIGRAIDAQMKRYIPDIKGQINIWVFPMDAGALGFLQIGDGIQLRYGYWPSPGDTRKGAVVVLGGRTEFLEKYLGTIQKINARGFDAFSIDWRGQGLSSRLLPDPTKGFINTYDEYVADLECFFETVVRRSCSGPLIVLAHSMGANILVQYLARYPRSVDKGVMLSPMIHVRTEPVPEAVVRLACRLMVRFGQGGKNIPSIKRNDSFRRSFPGNWLTHDRQRFDRVQELLR
jgi:lysophospholipase